MKKFNDLKPKRRYWFGIVIVVIFIVLVFLFIQNKWIVVSQYSVVNERIPEDFDGFRVVQVSDFHNAKFGKNNMILVEKIMKLKPDIIVITGDLIDSNDTDIPVAIELLKQLVQIAPTYYVTGNHENWLVQDDKQELLEKLVNSGVVNLKNEALDLKKNDSSICLIGLNDENLSDETLAKITKDLDQDSYKILLAHEPQHFERYEKSSVDLILSGHAHGGQFRFPIVGGLYAPDQGFQPKYSKGLYREGSSSMIVSAGLGNSVIKVRLLNHPDLVCVDLSN